MVELLPVDAETLVWARESAGVDPEDDSLDARDDVFAAIELSRARCVECNGEGNIHDPSGIPWQSGKCESCDGKGGFGEAWS